LKQLQLIQILCINAPGAAAVADPGAKAAGINRILRAPDRAKAASGRAEAAFGKAKTADLGRLALYRVVTASTSGALDLSRTRFGDALRVMRSRLTGGRIRPAGIETPADRRSSDRLYLSAA
jgi:hypothetical protein